MSERLTSFDVAKRAGVSRSVVSAVLNNTPGIGVSKEKRQAVLKAIEELNYRVDVQARGMRTGQSQCIAAFGNLENPMFLQMLQGLQQACTDAGFHVLLYGSGNLAMDRFGLLDLFQQRRIDGVVTKDSTHFSDPEWEEAVRSKNIPFVSVEGYPENERIASVLMDYAQSIHQAMDYLWERTAQPPVYVEIYNGDSYCPSWGDQERLHAYETWMLARALEPRVVSVPNKQWNEQGHWWISWLSSQKLPLTVLSNWSRGAVSIYHAAYHLGLRVGKDMFVMAADNTERVNSHLSPLLSAVEVPYQEMGAVAGQRLIEYIKGTRDKTDTKTIWVSCKLVPGESA